MGLSVYSPDNPILYCIRYLAKLKRNSISVIYSRS